MAKVLCILRHCGAQLILAYSWARPAILVAGKDRGGMFLFLLFLDGRQGGGGERVVQRCCVSYVTGASN